MADKFSIVIPCRNEKPFLEEMLESFALGVDDQLLEVIIVDDGSTDGSCDFLRKPGFRGRWPVQLLTKKDLGPARARNEGADTAKGEILLFCDAHLMIKDPDWLEKLVAGLIGKDVGAVCPGIRAVENTGAIGYGGTLDSNLTFSWLPEPAKISPVPIGPGGCIAVRKDVFHDIGGFEENFPVWGFEDIELSIKLWLFGYEIVVNPEVEVMHVFRAIHPYPIRYREVDYNLLWLAICHFNQQRLLKVVEMVNARKDLNENLQRLYSTGVWEKSRALRARRKYDDDWYFAKFRISF